MSAKTEVGRLLDHIERAGPRAPGAISNPRYFAEQLSLCFAVDHETQAIVLTEIARAIEEAIARQTAARLELGRFELLP